MASILLKVVGCTSSGKFGFVEAAWRCFGGTSFSKQQQKQFHKLMSQRLKASTRKPRVIITMSATTLLTAMPAISAAVKPFGELNEEGDVGAGEGDVEAGEGDIEAGECDIGDGEGDIGAGVVVVVAGVVVVAAA